MNNSTRYLITTANEKTWKFDRPVIFLGEWCRLYDRKHIWAKMDSIISKPYGVGNLKKKIDYLKVKELEEKLFPKFYKLLNKYHGKQYEERFWSIFLGHWFRTIVQLLYNRINTLRECVSNENIYGTTIFRSDYSSLASPDFGSALISFNDDKWNNVLYGRILKLLNNKNIKFNFTQDIDELFTYPGFENKTFKNKDSFKKKILKIYSKISKKIIKNDDAVIINTYLPKIEEIKLQLSLGQFPQIPIIEVAEINLKPNQLIRKDLTKSFSFESENNIENIIKKLLFELVPVCYLEGYDHLYKIIEKKSWPKSPKFIFTSNSFYKDEAFKLWTASKVVKGTKYFVGQHGNNYFTKRNMFPRTRSPKIEEKTAYKFITWGWSNNHSKYIPAFIFKTIGKKTKKFNSNGRLLLTEVSQSIRHTTWDAISEHKKYFEEQKKFISQLKVNPRKNIIIRLHKLFKDRKFHEDLRWKDFDKTLELDLGNTPIEDLIAKSRLVIHSYDSTGMLETFSQNIPTLAFWQNGLSHLCESAKPHYKILVDAGIIHLSPSSISKKVNEIWNDVDDWWNQEHIQEAKNQFCSIYAKNCKKPTRLLKSILLEE